MGKLIAVVFLWMTINIFYVIEVSSQQQRSCRAIVSDLNKREIQSIGKCTKTLKYTNVRDKIAKSSCVMKCVLSTENIITPAGEFSQANLDAFVDREFPEELRPKIKGLIAPCVEQYGKILDPNDEFCKSYEPAMKCFSSKLPSFCK